jgi:hypothetical protein
MAGLGSRPPWAPGGLGLEASLAMRYGKVQKAKRAVVPISPAGCTFRVFGAKNRRWDTVDIAASRRFYPASIRIVLRTRCVHVHLWSSSLSVGAAN